MWSAREKFAEWKAEKRKSFEEDKASFDGSSQYDRRLSLDTPDAR